MSIFIIDIILFMETQLKSNFDFYYKDNKIGKCFNSSVDMAAQTAFLQILKYMKNVKENTMDTDIPFHIKNSRGKIYTYIGHQVINILETTKDETCYECTLTPTSIPSTD